MDCPCGRRRGERRLRFDECCAPFLQGEARAPDAESLMRSRFTAFARGHTDYLDATRQGSHLVGSPAGRNPPEASAGPRWLHLEIVDTVAGRATDTKGEVEFIATFVENGKPARLRERSRFEKIGGRWLYLDGTPEVTAVDVGAMGRNAPCWCGSGKKLKKCRH